MRVICSHLRRFSDPARFICQDDENDMLDMAFGLTDTSRLGCQVRLTRDLDGITATLPAATRNMFVDGAYHFSIEKPTRVHLSKIREKADAPLAYTGFVHSDALEDFVTTYYAALMLRI